MRKISIILMLACFFISCQKQKLSYPTDGTIDDNNKEKIALLNSFVSLLSKAVNNEPKLREFLKHEALKEIDKDNNVIYHFVKNSFVENNKTFEEILTKYESHQGELSNIVSNIPTISILIPKLPNAFSAITWNAQKDIPAVSSNFLNNDQKFEIFFNGEFELALSKEKIPGFPILVVKENERIRHKNILTKSSTKRIIKEEDFEFIADEFNGRIKTKSLGGRYNFVVDESIVNAYDLFQTSSNKWQRDHIYYNLIDAPDTKGTFNQEFSEYITVIKFSESALSRFMDQDDPKINNQINTVFRSITSDEWWTDGKFDFKIDILVNNISGIGTTITRYLSVDPEDLFDVTYTDNVERGVSRPFYIFTKQNISSREYYCNIPLMGWDLERNGFSWKFLISEIDDQQTQTRTETYTSEFATNFGVSAGVPNKFGLNFGASTKTSRTQTFTIVSNVNSDDLGSLEMNFSEPVLTSKIQANPIFILGGRQNPNTYIMTLDLTNKTQREDYLQFINKVGKDGLYQSGSLPPSLHSEQQAIANNKTDILSGSSFRVISNGEVEMLVLPQNKY